MRRSRPSASSRRVCHVFRPLISYDPSSFVLLQSDLLRQLTWYLNSISFRFDSIVTTSTRSMITATTSNSSLSPDWYLPSSLASKSDLVLLHFNPYLGLHCPGGNLEISVAQTDRTEHFLRGSHPMIRDIEREAGDLRQGSQILVLQQYDGPR